MADLILVTPGTQILFANHGGDYVGGTGNNTLQIAGATEVQINVTSLAVGAARQAVKIDLGEFRADFYSVMMSLEMAEDPAANKLVELHWSPSPVAESSPAVGNAGGCSGADDAYSGYAASTLAEALFDLDFIGSLNLAVMNDSDGVPQLGKVGAFSPTERYGSLVVFNGADVAFHNDTVEFAVSFIPKQWKANQ